MRIPVRSSSLPKLVVATASISAFLISAASCGESNEVGGDYDIPPPDASTRDRFVLSDPTYSDAGPGTIPFGADATVSPGRSDASDGVDYEFADSGLRRDASDAAIRVPEAGGSIGSGSVSADAGATSSLCVRISEYLEGSASNKALEILNCGDAPLDFSRVGYCLISNSETTCSVTGKWTGVVPAGGAVTLCGTNFALDPARCSGTSASIRFNGDDRVVLFEDADSDGAWGAGEQVLDAFGETTVRPIGSPWADKTFRRTQCTRYDGKTSFDVSTLFSEHPLDDISNLGTAPAMTCP